MWFMAVVGVVSAIAGFMGQSSAAKAQAIIAKANADAENTVRKARNEYEVSVAALNNTIRSSRNKQVLEAAGSQYNALGQNLVRLEDEVLRGKLESRISSAEALGELTAASSVMGVGGSAVDVIENTLRLQEARNSQQYQQNADYRVYDLRAQQSSMIANAVRSMDSGQDIANVDYSTSIAAYVPKPSFFSALLQGVSNAAPYIAAGYGGGKSGAMGQGESGAKYIGTGVQGSPVSESAFTSYFNTRTSHFNSFTDLGS